MSDALTPISPDPGPTTTEFWVSTLTGVLSLAVAAAELVHTNFNPQGLQILIPSAAVIAAAITAAVYSHSRAAVKRSAQESTAVVQAASASTAPIASTRSASTASNTALSDWRTRSSRARESAGSAVDIPDNEPNEEFEYLDLLETLARHAARRHPAALPVATPFNGVRR